VFVEHPTKVSTEILMGSYLVVHDEAKLARGEPCTSIYSVETFGSREEAVVSFLCVPRPRPVVERFTVATDWDQVLGMHTLTEYQFAGEAESHSVPIAAVASDQLGVRASAVCTR
jgi:hypothetical protein